MSVQIYAFIAVLAAFAVMMGLDVIAQRAGHRPSHAKAPGRRHQH